MKHGGDIWLGDLLSSWQALAPGDEATRAAMARLLGFELATVQPEAPAAAPSATPPAPPAPETTARHPPPVEVSPAGAKQQYFVSDLPRASEPLYGRDPQREWQAVEALARADTATRAAMSPPELFRPEWARTLVTTLAARLQPGRAIDEVRLVRDLAGGHPLERIPRLPRWTLGLGVQLLIDVAPGMEPFAADQIALSEHFAEAVGEAHVEEWLFADCPLRGVFAEADTEVWQPPQPGVPVIAVSDLGLGAPADHLARASVQEWLELAGQLAARGSRLTVLSPWPRARVPAALAERIALVEWDRPTSAAQVRRLLERHDG
ncbi:hypothetical protein [Cognatazoarcus halotolerans]|uniref:hypothetical protein n=1 Tax=Cognatazoarcus halotolerans TaxID=2686016 RepID=UPI00135AD586|nr:hypothetical protein [Cognatazoarcus halotolerans]MCP5310191.1 hypothetical protein [Zoogloeaceae bacterium]